MTELVRKCSCRWEGGKCRLSSALAGWGCKLLTCMANNVTALYIAPVSLSGWGCKLLTCMPETVPHTDKEKAKLFAEVYQYADKVGVLECPHYDETAIDRTLDDAATNHDAWQTM